MKSSIAVVLILALASMAMGSELPTAPKVQMGIMEHDPGAWAFTTGSAAVMTGAFTRPWIGFAVGSGIGIASNMQDSRNAHQNMVGAIVGAAVGYVIIKSLRRDWRKK